MKTSKSAAPTPPRGRALIGLFLAALAGAPWTAHPAVAQETRTQENAAEETVAPENGACQSSSALGVSRVIEIDGARGGLYGGMSPRANRPGTLAKMEVALTFDDGPMPWITKSILDTLDKACVKATFFSVGRMAMAYPQTVRDILARGHTLGTHTYSHPFNMPRMNREKAETEIEQGFAAVAAAAGGPISPFFRFTGLSDSAVLIDYLGRRNVAAFTVDVVSNDSYISDPAELARRTVAGVEANRGGIILFHDIKASTAKALPTILAQLKARGYSIVHFKAAAPAEPQVDLLAHYAQALPRATVELKGLPAKPLPFYGAIGPDRKDDATPAAQTKDGDDAAKSATLTPAKDAAKPQPLRGGLDLARKQRDAHPALTAFSTGYPDSVSTSASAAASDSASYKGSIWESMDSWSGGLSGTSHKK